MGLGRLSTVASVLAALSLCACAVYRPAPLSEAVAPILAQPDFTAAPTPLKPIPIDLSQPLTPAALGLIAVYANPDLKAARAKAQVAEAQVFEAGLLPDPSLTFGTDQILSGPDTSNAFTAQIALDLNALRTRPVTRQAARRTRDQARLDLAWQEWQTAGQARLLAARIAGLTEALALDVQTRDATAAMLTRVLNAAARGDVKADEIEARRLAASDASDKTRLAERDLDAARHDLNRLLGVRPETRIAIVADRPMALALDAEALFAKARAQRLDLHALEAGYDSQEAATRKAVMDQFPNLQLTLTRSQDTTGNQTLGPSVNFSLPVWNRNAGGIAMARATRAQLRAEYAARIFATRADIADLVAGLNLARRQRDELAAQVAPLSRIAEASAQAAERGDIALAASDAARQSVVDRQIALVSLDQSLAEQSIALELAVGGPLTP